MLESRDYRAASRSIGASGLLGLVGCVIGSFKRIAVSKSGWRKLVSVRV